LRTPRIPGGGDDGQDADSTGQHADPHLHHEDHVDEAPARVGTTEPGYEQELVEPVEGGHRT
jgi:hypothetical protein